MVERFLFASGNFIDANTCHVAVIRHSPPQHVSISVSHIVDDVWQIPPCLQAVVAMPSLPILPLEIEETILDLVAQDDNDHSVLKQ